MSSADSSWAEAVTLADAAERLGVHYMTAYRYVRTGRMPAHKVGGQWRVLTNDLAAVATVATGPRASGTGNRDTAPREHLREPLISRLLAGDTAGCWDIITDALRSGATPSDVHTALLQPALTLIGERWSDDELTIADEHRATATASRLVGRLGPMFRTRGRRRGTVVLGGVSGDAHAMPTAMVADLLAARRFDVVDLGADTPTASILEAARGMDDLVGIGVVVVFDECVPAAIECMQELRTALPSACLVIGGRPSLRARLDVALESGAVDGVTGTAAEVGELFEAAADG